MSNEEITYEQVVEYCKKRNLDLIDHAFLIRLYNNRKSIPIEWIKEWYKTHVYYLKEKKPIIYAYEQMIMDWEKENDE